MILLCVRASITCAARPPSVTKTSVCRPAPSPVSKVGDSENRSNGGSSRAGWIRSAGPNVFTPDPSASCDGSVHFPSGAHRQPASHQPSLSPPSASAHGWGAPTAVSWHFPSSPHRQPSAQSPPSARHATGAFTARS